MSKVVFYDFINKRYLETSARADQEPAPAVDMFGEFDAHIKGIVNRFGDKEFRASLPYAQSFKASFDTYGHGCTNNSLHEYQPKPADHWNRPFPVPADLRAIDRFLQGKAGQTIRVGGKSDPFMWMDKKYRVTKYTLELANKYGVKLELYTMSDLCANSDYADLLVAGDHTVVMRLGYANETLERRASPGAPSMARRLHAIAELQSRGVTVRTKPPVVPDRDTQFKKLGGFYINSDGTLAVDAQYLRSY